MWANETKVKTPNVHTAIWEPFRLAELGKVTRMRQNKLAMIRKKEENMPRARSRDDSMVVRAPIGPSQCTTKRTFVMEKSAGIMSIAQGVSDSTARWAVLQVCLCN